MHGNLISRNIFAQSHRKHDVKKDSFSVRQSLINTNFCLADLMKALQQIYFSHRIYFDALAQPIITNNNVVEIILI